MHRPLSSLVVAVTAAAFLLAAAACSAPPAPVAAASSAPAASASTTRLAQVAGSSDSLPATISVNGVGAVSAAPDVAYVQLGVETINADPAAAVKESTDKMAAVMAALAAQGIPAEAIQTVSYDMTLEQVPNQDGQPSGEIRYHVGNIVRIKVTDLSKTAAVLSTALEAGANTVSGVEFGVLDPVALQVQARDKAIADAQAKATQLANGFGAKLGPIHNVNEFSGPMPTAARFDTSAAVANAAVPVSPGQLTVTIEVQATYDIAR